jgi:hemoglobin-like flavoprotein
MERDRSELLMRIVVHSVVRPSYQRCCEQGDEFFDAFYDKLSEKAPEIGPMFAGVNMRRQNALLQKGIESLLACAEGSATARDELLRLGDLHARDRINVRPELYPLWIDALMESVREFDSEHHELTEPAWRATIAAGIELIVSRY